MTETTHLSEDGDVQVLVERTDLGDGTVLGTLRFHRPKALNAITPTMLGQATAGLDQLLADDAVGVIRLTGSGRAFSAGVDLKALESVKVLDGAVGSGLDDLARGFIQDIERSPKVVIAQVNGFCFTGALEIALACDIIIIAQQAKLGDTHAKWGLRPTWGMSQRLPRLVGVARARELSLTGRTFSGEQALAWGMAAFAPPLEDLDMTVLDIAQQVAQNSRGSLSAYKDLYRVGSDCGLTEGLDYEAAAEYSIPDTQERLRGFLD